MECRMVVAINRTKKRHVYVNKHDIQIRRCGIIANEKSVYYKIYLPYIKK